MAKNIVFCADGTWNGPGEDESDTASSPPTNVFKLFLKLSGTDDPGSTRLADEQEKSKAVDGIVTQVAKYLHGVGDSKNFLVHALGGGLGEGLITRIVRGYTFVSRNYVPGDRIYLAGFSRGAYTVRALAGLISAKGLLPPNVASDDNKEDAYRQGSAVWYEWRQQTLDKAPNLLGSLQEWAQDLPHFLFDPAASVGLVPAPIEAVAVWDTVGAYGIPEFNLQQEAVDSFQFADTQLSDNVHHGRHAVSIDERRGNFTPTLWDADLPRIVQVLFPGGHADVGGGYPGDQSGLSDCALAWITRELKSLGVEIGNPVLPEAANATGMGHQEWLKPPWPTLPHGPREIPISPNLYLSEAVLLRAAAAGVIANSEAGTLPSVYAPGNIPTYLAAKLAAASVVVIPINEPEA
jgi:uncharacterized protein (DUF2235 family)